MKAPTNIYPWLFIICISTNLQSVLGDSRILLDNKSDMNISITSDSNYVNETSTIQADQHHSSIVKLKLNLKETSIIPYIRDEIFDRSYAYNISTEDIIDLFDLRSKDLNATIEILESLNISVNTITVKHFRLVLDFVNMTYPEFYEKLKTGLNMTGLALPEALQALNIDAANYSLAVTFGTQDGIYDVLSKGVYTRETFQNATAKLGTNVDSFYENVKTIILDQMITKSLSYYEEKIKLSLPSFDKKNYDDLWTVFDISLFDVYLVPNVKKIIDDLYLRLDQNLTLGVSTSPHEIIIHKEIYKRMQNILKVVNINAVVVVSPEKIYENLIVKRETEKNFATLYSNSSIAASIEIFRDLTRTNDQNCTYITINGSRIIENQVKIVNNSHSSLIVEMENGTMFNVGNPLICQEKLVGLASTQSKENLFIFDDFYYSAEKVPTSGSYDAKVGTIVFLYMIFLYALRLIR